MTNCKETSECFGYYQSKKIKTSQNYVSVANILTLQTAELQLQYEVPNCLADIYPIDDHNSLMQAKKENERAEIQLVNLKEQTVFLILSYSFPQMQCLILF